MFSSKTRVNDVKAGNFPRKKIISRAFCIAGEDAQYKSPGFLTSSPKERMKKPHAKSSREAHQKEALTTAVNSSNDALNVVNASSSHAVAKIKSRRNG